MEIWLRIMKLMYVVYWCFIVLKRFYYWNIRCNLRINKDLLIPSQEKGEFEWDTTTQSIILGSFYWCYVFSQVIGGLLTQYFGTKVVFGFSQFITAICSLLIPQAAVMHYVLVIILRSIQGVASVS